MSFILIADDDTLYSKDLKTILGFELCRYSVQIAQTCCKALSLVTESSKPDAIVLDMMLPWDETDTNGGLPPENPMELRGLRTLRDLKRMNYDLRRIIVVTAFYNHEARGLLLDSGIAPENVLIKPARTTEILARIRAACALKES